VSEVCLQSAFPNWDAMTHGDRSYAVGETGLCICPAEVASHLLHNAGFRKATAADIGAELAVLEARIAQLKSF
jgi:hypothetical protein